MLQIERLANTTNLLKMILAELSAEVEAAKTLPLNQVLVGWYNAREEYELLDDIRTEIGKLFEQMSRGTIPEMMRANDSKTVTVDSIRRRFTISKRFSCSIIPERKGEAYEFLRPIGLISETVNSSTLSSFAKKRMEEEGEEMPADLFKTNIMDITSATKV
jgi:hypothetical protein